MIFEIFISGVKGWMIPLSLWFWGFTLRHHECYVLALSYNPWPFVYLFFEAKSYYTALTSLGLTV